jgi:hypothetical protein
MPILHTIMEFRITKIGSTENGTICDDDFLAVIKNRLYLCSAFETQMPEIEY